MEDIMEDFSILLRFTDGWDYEITKIDTQTLRWDDPSDNPKLILEAVYGDGSMVESELLDRMNQNHSFKADVWAAYVSDNGYRIPKG
jgi:hypothetical protein